MEIKYRKGLPTKQSIQQLINEFDPKMKLYPSSMYGKSYGLNALIWQDKYTQTRMDDFIAHATDLGINFGKYDSYNSPSVGHLHLNKV